MRQPTPPGVRRARLAGLLLLAAGLVACAARSAHFSMGEADRPAATLSLLTDEAEAVRPLSAIAERFHARRSRASIQISFLSGESNFFTLLSTKFAVGDSPDLMISQPSSNVELYAHGGYLMDLAGSLTARPAYRPFTRIIAVGNRIYALPLEIDASGLLVNLDLLHRFGIHRVPGTFNEFLSDCSLLRSRGLIDPLVLAGSDGIELLRFLKQYLAENLYDVDASFSLQVAEGLRSWDSPALRRAFMAFSKLKGYANPDALEIGRDEAVHRFVHGEAAFAIEDSDLLPFVHLIAPNLAVALVRAPWSAAATGRGVLFGVGSVAYASNMTRRPASVTAFLGYIASRHVVEGYAGQVGGVSLFAPLSSFGSEIEISGAGSSRQGSAGAGGGWDPAEDWLPGLDIAFGRLAQDWYAGRSTASVLASLEKTQRELARANPDLSRALLARAG